MHRRVEYKWIAAAILATAAAINYADRAAVSAVFPLLRSDLGLSDVALGSLGSVFLWSYAVTSPLAGFLADRLPRARLVALSLAVWSGVTAVAGFSAVFWQLLMCRALLGVAESAYLPAATALLADHHRPATRATAMSVHSVGLNLGVVVGGTLAGFLGDRLGWRPGFWVLGAGGILFALICRLALREAPASADRAPSPPVLEGLATLIRIPSYLLLLAKAMLAAVGVWSFLNWLPLFYQETFGMSLAAAGFAGTFLLQSATTLGIASGGVGSDWLARRHARYRVLLQSLCYFVAAPFLLAFRGRPGFALASVSIFAFSFFRGLGQANENPVLCDVVAPRLRSTAIGFMNTGATLAGGIGVMLTGFLKRDFGLAGIFAGVGLLFVVAGCLMLVSYFFFLDRDLRRQSEV